MGRCGVAPGGYRSSDPSWVKRPVLGCFWLVEPAARARSQRIRARVPGWAVVGLGDQGCLLPPASFARFKGQPADCCAWRRETSRSERSCRPHGSRLFQHRGCAASGSERTRELAGVEKGWETECAWSTCGTAGKRYVSCSDPNEATHYHFDGRSCMCESSRRQCGECDPNAPCTCAFDVGEWCRTP